MGIIRHMAKEAIREMSNKSREFYEFVLPPVDIHLDEKNLVVTIDMPGFNKNDIKLNIHRNILSINAEKKENGAIQHDIICNQRPNKLDKKIRLPIRVKEGEEKVNSAKYENGVLTLKFPVENGGKNISIE